MKIPVLEKDAAKQILHFLFTGQIAHVISQGESSHFDNSIEFFYNHAARFTKYRTHVSCGTKLEIDFRLQNHPKSLEFYETNGKT